MDRTISAEEFIARLEKSKYAGTKTADDMLNILFKCDSEDIEPSEDMTGKKAPDKVLVALKKYYFMHGYMPSYREICEMTGIRSSSTVKSAIDSLRASGEIETDIPLKSIPSRGFRLKGYKNTELE